MLILLELDSAALVSKDEGGPEGGPNGREASVSNDECGPNGREASVSTDEGGPNGPEKPPHGRAGNPRFPARRSSLLGAATVPATKAASSEALTIVPTKVWYKRMTGHIQYDSCV